MTSFEPEPARLAPLLSDVLGHAVDVRQVERLSPWLVARVSLVLSLAGVGPTVIVKWGCSHPDHWPTDPDQMLTERAALEFLAELGLDVAPHLLGYEEETGVLVLEDLAPRASLWELLQADEDRGVVGLRAFAATMGRLHAATARRATAYYQHRRSLGPVDAQRDRGHLDGEVWRWDLPRVAAFGVTPSADAVAEMGRARQVLLDDGPFVVFSNGDAGANNFFVDGHDGRIIDWEWAGYRHALLDAACLFVPGPMWMTVADPVPLGVEDAYRAALATGVEEAADDAAFALGMTAACMARAVQRLQRLPKLDARPAGHESRAQMVSTLEAAARAGDHFHALPHLANWANEAAQALRRRWPDADREFPNAYTRRE